MVEKEKTPESTVRVTVQRNNTHGETIVLFSPDMDFCMSLRLLYQEKYEIVTTTDPEMILDLVASFHPDLVILDAFPTNPMRRRFKEIKKEYPAAQIMVFYASQFNDRGVREVLRTSVDAAFSKPIDLNEVTERIYGLITGDRGCEVRS